MTTWIVLLRGINVGRAHQVPMGELREVLAEIGMDDVRTQGRSGNIVLRSDLGGADVRSEIETAIEQRFGFVVPVVLRSPAEFREILREEPFPDGDPSRVQVTFRDEALEKAEVAALEEVPADCPDQLVARSREVVAHHPNGISKSQLPRTVNEVLRDGTARNWRTVTKLAELAELADE